jgi:hypothetical protein
MPLLNLPLLAAPAGAQQAREVALLAVVEEEIMTNVLKLMRGAAIAALSIASPALAQSASQNDPSISAHHSKHLKKNSEAAILIKRLRRA